MHTQIARALAAGTVLALPLLTACGSSTAPQSTSTAPSAASQAAAPSTSTAPTPTGSTTPSDETANVRAASTTFIKTVFAYDSSTSYAEYRDRLKPEMTDAGFKTFEAAHFDQALQTFRSRFGKQARTTTKVLGTPKVIKLTSDSATVSVKYGGKVQQRRDGKWRTVKTMVDDEAKIPLVKQGERWLVDDLS